MVNHTAECLWPRTGGSCVTEGHQGTNSRFRFFNRATRCIVRTSIAAESRTWCYEMAPGCMCHLMGNPALLQSTSLTSVLREGVFLWEAQLVPSYRWDISFYQFLFQILVSFLLDKLGKTVVRLQNQRGFQVHTGWTECKNIV
ncbi:hypothetical protein DPMN_024088 [Dreissena polymorpha]|uniref:Uncharacterized protein n=1 Tax=Dreissena polymorpha TaxID=45954 RepID=A0A9D4LN91_DREPO|nr:hypothetical protein DPMN_024088 [Dreissena polymorpha]